MTQVSIHEAKTHLSAILSTMERLQEPVLICRHGKAIAELRPLPRGRRSVVREDLCPTFLAYDPAETTEGDWEDA